MKSVRALQKKAFRYNPNSKEILAYGRNDWEFYPINYFVFSFDSVKLERLASHMRKIQEMQKMPPWSRIDGVCVLNRGMITNKQPYTNKEGKTIRILQTLPEDDTELGPAEMKRPLLFFYEQIMGCWTVAEVPNFNMIMYLLKTEL